MLVLLAVNAYTLFAPDDFKTLQHSFRVLPVVKTSSTSKIVKPSTLLELLKVPSTFFALSD